MLGPRFDGRSRLHQRKLRFEALEDRRVLSAAASTFPIGDPGDDLVLIPTPRPESTVLDSEVPFLTYNNFHLLTVAQIPLLSDAQVATIPNHAWFSQLDANKRLALKDSQIRSLQVATVTLQLLTPTQIGKLTTDQIQTLTFWDFHRLNVNQIQFLLPEEQIATIPDMGIFGQMSDNHRWALTQLQVQKLNFTTLRMEYINATQRGWLMPDQIKDLMIYDFVYLTPAQIPHLSNDQIEDIVDMGIFGGLSNQQRWAMTMEQVQHLNTATLRMTYISSTQVAWLTPEQITSMIIYDFNVLHPNQMQHLSDDQIDSIQNMGIFGGLSDAQRWALTMPQVQRLNTAVLRIQYISATQRGWLTVDQIQDIVGYEIPLLTDSQIPFLSLDQFAVIDQGVFMGFSDSVKANLTRAQMMALPLTVLSAYMQVEMPQYPPAGYHPAVHAFPDPNDPIGLPVAHDATAVQAFNLVKLQDVTHTAIASGNWFSTSTWSNGQIPTANAKVYIPADKSVTFNGVMTQAIKTLRVDGTLTFATNIDTTMRVDTIVVYTTGKLYIGTQTAPIANNVTAKILIPDGGNIDRAWDPNLVSRGLISRGEVRMYGRTVTPYATLAIDPMFGASTLTLTQAPVGWAPGDELVIAGTGYEFSDFHSERVRIQSISGTLVTLDRSLSYSHDAPDGFSIQVANTNRNIQFIGEGDPTNLYLKDVEPAAFASIRAQYREKVQQRPHIMFIDNPNVVVENVLVQGFGRTNKDVAITAPVIIGGVAVSGYENVRARYSLHFHHTGVNPNVTPAVIRNNVVLGSPGWGFVNHQSNVVMEYNVAIDAVGAGFSVEDGNEIGLMYRNLSMVSRGSGKQDHILARRNNNDFGHGGHGFWFQGPGVRAIENIATSTRGSGFAFQTASSQAMYDAINLDNPALAVQRLAIPVGVAPLKGFIGNRAYAVDAGVEMWFHQTNLNEGTSEIVDFKAWGVDSGIEMFYSGQIKIRDSALFGRYFANSVGIKNNRTTHNMVFENLHIEGFETGLIAPPRRSTVIEGGQFSNVWNLVIGKGGDTLRSLHVTDPITFITPTTTQLAGRTPLNVSLTQAWAPSVADNTGRNVNSLFANDDILIAMSDGTTLRMYYADQAASAKPFPTAPSIAGFPTAYVNKSNQDIFDLSDEKDWFNGGDLPAGTFTPNKFVGLAVVVSPSSPADFDGNQRVDGRDFMAWQRGFGHLAAVKSDGDANGDRKVDALDFAILAEEFGTHGAAIASASGAALALVAPPGDENTTLTSTSLAADAAMAYEQLNAEPLRKSTKWRHPRQ